MKSIDGENNNGKDHNAGAYGQDALGIVCTTRDYCNNGYKFRFYEEYRQFQEYLDKTFVPLPVT